MKLHLTNHELCKHINSHFYHHSSFIQNEMSRRFLALFSGSGRLAREHCKISDACNQLHISFFTLPRLLTANLNPIFNTFIPRLRKTVWSIMLEQLVLRPASELSVLLTKRILFQAMVRLNECIGTKSTEVM